MINKYKKILISIFGVLRKISVIIFTLIIIPFLIFSLLSSEVSTKEIVEFVGIEKNSFLWFLPIVLILFFGFMSDFFSLSIWSLKYKNKKTGKKRAKWRNKVDISFKK